MQECKTDAHGPSPTNENCQSPGCLDLSTLVSRGHLLTSRRVLGEEAMHLLAAATVPGDEMERRSGGGLGDVGWRILTHGPSK